MTQRLLTITKLDSGFGPADNAWTLIDNLDGSSVSISGFGVVPTRREAEAEACRRIVRDAGWDGYVVGGRLVPRADVVEAWSALFVDEPAAP